MRGRLALIRRLPPDVVVRRALGLVGRTVGATIHRQRDRQRPSYCNDPPDGPLLRLIGPIPRDALRVASGWIVPAAELYRNHYFDLLGSGWLRNTHGMACRGVEGQRYEPAPAIDADRDGNWLRGRINPANVTTSRRTWRVTRNGYQPSPWPARPTLGRHIVGHLERSPEEPANPYLADIAGLAFIAAALPRSSESDCWLAFAVQELRAETEYQFYADGANFEASTSYHRLAAEMTLFASALIVGLPAEKQAALVAADPAALRTRPPRHLASTPAAPGPRHFTRLALAAEFSRAVT